MGLTVTSGRVSAYGDTNGLLAERSRAKAGVTLTDLSYNYGVDGQLTATIGNLDPLRLQVYAYDALDCRIAKTVDGVTEAWVYDTADLSDSTALTFRAGALVKRWLFGPRTNEPLAYEAYSGTTAPGSGSVIELLANRLGSIITAISVSTGATAEFSRVRGLQVENWLNPR